MQLRDGPFKQLHGRWEFHALAEDACKVTLTLEFEPSSRLLGRRWRSASRGWPIAWSTISSASPTRAER
jgi:ribosome-associated toxin RatA of RatAB toxin-antitoxin module